MNVRLRSAPLHIVGKPAQTSFYLRHRPLVNELDIFIYNSVRSHRDPYTVAVECIMSWCDDAVFDYTFSRTWLLYSS